MLLFLFFSKGIVKIFNDEPLIVQYGAEVLQIIGAGYIFYGIGMVMIQALNGAGDTKTPTWINFLAFGFFKFHLPICWQKDGEWVHMVWPLPFRLQKH
jgi:Na+-driven multidrug efflux pump